MGRGGWRYTSTLLNLGTRWRSVVNANPPPPLLTAENKPHTLQTGGWVHPRDGRAFWRRDISLAPIGIQTPARTNRSLLAMQITPSRNVDTKLNSQENWNFYAHASFWILVHVLTRTYFIIRKTGYMENRVRPLHIRFKSLKHLSGFVSRQMRLLQ